MRGPGLDQALAALRAGDTLVVLKLDRLARSVPDAREIADGLAARGIRLQLGSTVHDPADRLPHPRLSGGDVMPTDLEPPRPVLLKSQTRQANWRRANLPKYRAHLAVRRALVSGALEKQHCEVCGHTTVDAHHDRYDEPLNVRWLCRRHHVRLHQGGEDMFPLCRPSRKAGSHET